MARQQRNNVDYFPFMCEDGNKMFYLEETYGNDGFAVFVKLLRELARTNYHYLDLSKNTTMMFLSAKCKVAKKVLEAIINDLVDLEKFDRELWEENRIIWCQDFIDSIQDAYKKRSNNCINRISLIQILISKGVRKPPKSNPKPLKLPSDSPVNPQRIEEDSIEEKRKENIRAFDFEENEKFIKKICNYFSQEGEEREMKVYSFLKSLNNQNKLEEFKTQTEAYIEYKNKSKEIAHGWLSYQTDWENTDWIHKLSKLGGVSSKMNKEVKEKVKQYD
ncbi:DUF4373 domain-containing protein [Aquimarina macrocephali]|uniref:DUF4373 domain-containing protein n=1 Tax=Aquimarina macrocephali TaxID=666563 RepID=UPI003F67B5C4